MVLKERSPNYFVGSPEEGYRYSYFEPGFERYRLPPGRPRLRRDSSDHRGMHGVLRPEPVQVVWAELYEPWFTAIDELFQ